MRAALFAHKIELVSGVPVTVVPAGVTPSEDAINEVHGAIPDLAQSVTVTNDGSLTYMGQPVVMIFNPNLLGQVARRDDIDLTELVGPLRPGLLHEGTWMTCLGFDKTAQQDLLRHLHRPGRPHPCDRPGRHHRQGHRDGADLRRLVHQARRRLRRDLRPAPRPLHHA